MKYLCLTENELESKGALHTAQEITQQPGLWKKVYQLIDDQKEALGAFLETAYGEVDQIILTGAGTSAFIGISLQHTYFRHSGILTRAIPTTDLLSHPCDYLDADHTTLMVSFARSGSSPESCAALMLADKLTRKCIHLIITCNESGDLARFQTPNPKYLILLPPESNDRSLVMTSSYTGMLLVGILIARIKHLSVVEEQLQLLCRYGQKILSDYTETIKSIAQMPFKRVVFLGAGPLSGTAVESQLKLQELTDGKVICKQDTYLGFRHGPKVVVDDGTLVVYLFSNVDYVSGYEKDLVRSMQNGKKALFEVGIGEALDPALNLNAAIDFSGNGQHLGEDFLSVCSILPVQILGFFTSLKYGLKPDTPSASGAIARIVEGVTIYPFDDKTMTTETID